GRSQHGVQLCALLALAEEDQEIKSTIVLILARGRDGACSVWRKSLILWKLDGARTVSTIDFSWCLFRPMTGMKKQPLREKSIKLT
ncbi:MAG: hypothetical protein ILP23_07005, partial [Paludibacteraceae bacterium]|nr:hypothetical protein [Paludibacteraceae bacterium]